MLLYKIKIINIIYKKNKKIYLKVIIIIAEKNVCLSNGSEGIEIERKLVLIGKA